LAAAPTWLAAVTEPVRAEGIGVRCHRVAQASGSTVAITIRNDTEREWRLRCAAADWRHAGLRRISEVPRRRLRRSGPVDFDPGAEHTVLVFVPAKSNRLWVKVRPARQFRSVIFAVSWPPDPRDVAPGDADGARRFLLHVVAPFALVAGFVGLTSGRAGVAVVLLVPFAIALHTDLCVRRLERKLARLRAA
jgi:hypothetical protein